MKLSKKKLRVALFGFWVLEEVWYIVLGRDDWMFVFSRREANQILNRTTKRCVYDMEQQMVHFN